MAKTVQDIIRLIEEKNIKMVDFKMVDINGQFRHVTIPATHFNEDTMRNGVGFDASNYGYAVVEKSDMVFIPDPDTAVVDPFCDIPTLSMTGNAMIIDHPENRPEIEGLKPIRVSKFFPEGKTADGQIEDLSAAPLCPLSRGSRGGRPLA